MFRRVHTFLIHFACVFLIFLFFSNLPLYNLSSGREKNQEIASYEPIDTFNATEFIDKILNALEVEARYEADDLIGWTHVKDSKHDPDELMYVGYQVGLAGIADFLLDAYVTGKSHVVSLINDSITHFLDNRIQDPVEGTNWQRIANILSESWLGNRYGVAGISKYLARVQKENLVSNIENVISDAYRWVKNQKIEDGSLPISPNDYVTTGQEYGAAGMGSSFLLVGKYLQNASYIEFAKEIAIWINKSGTWDEDRFRVPWTPFGGDTEFDQYVATGFGVGEAGIIDFMLDLYEYTNENLFKDLAIGLAKDLIASDQGGYWNYGSVAYITTLYAGNDGLIGYYSGNSGIALQLLRIYNITKDPKLLKSSARAELFIEKLILESGATSIGKDYQYVHRTGLGTGAAGVANYYLDLYEKFGLERHLKTSEKILTHLYGIFQNYGLIPVNENNLDWGYSFNIDTGLAGIGKVLLHYIEILENIEHYQNLNDETGDEYDNLYSSLVVPTSIFSNSETGNITKSDDVENINFPGNNIIFVLLLSWVVRTRKRKR